MTAKRVSGRGAEGALQRPQGVDPAGAGGGVGAGRADVDGAGAEDVGDLAAGPRPGLSWRTSAATPATCGEAIEVPGVGEVAGADASR